MVLLSSMAASSALWQEEEQAQAARISMADRLARAEIMGSTAFEEDDPEAIRELLLLTFSWQFHDPAKIEGLDLYVPDDYGERSFQFGLMREDLVTFDFHEQLGELTIPALILYGADEPGAAIGGRALHAAMQNSEFALVDEAGHFPFVEQPEETLALVRDFLGSVSEDGAHE
jgi:pimeloyl-ACP methyl ester carboxylesterase